MPLQFQGRKPMVESLASGFPILVPPALLIVGLIGFSRLSFGWPLFRPGLAVELALLTFISFCIHRLQERPGVAATLFSALALAVYAAAIVKYQLLREPLRLFDLFLVDELLYFTPWVYKLLLCLVVAGSAFVVFRNFRRPVPLSTILALLPALIYLAGLLLFPSSVQKALDTVRQPGCCRADQISFRNGPVHTLLRNSASDLALLRAIRSSGPTRPQAKSANETLISNEVLNSLRSAEHRPNIHVVILESFLDPQRIKGLELDQDPLDPVFRRWLDEAPSSALAPTFGGGSAAGEFEILCGLPSYRLAGFEHMHFRGASVPCLPEVLREVGYHTMATNMSPPEFFNYEVTYQSVGFSEVWFEDDFTIESQDRDGPWISSEKIFRENLQLVKKALTRGQPILNHVVTGSGHTPFDMNEEVRPPLFGEESPHHKIANAAHYNSAALVDFLVQLDEIDADAMVIVISDHLPPIDLDFERYRADQYDDGYLLDSEQRRLIESQDSIALEMRRTELLVRMAGRSLPVGLVPHFTIPELALDLLTSGELCRSQQCQSHNGVILRPLGSRPVYTERLGFPDISCRENENWGEEPCRTAESLHTRHLESYRALLTRGIQRRTKTN